MSDDWSLGAVHQLKTYLDFSHCVNNEHVDEIFLRSFHPVVEWLKQKLQRLDDETAAGTARRNYQTTQIHREW